jgi:hypothetical protein
MRVSIVIICGCLLLSGCVSITPQAEKIQLHPPNSTQLAGCKKLGPISGQASAVAQMDYPDVDRQAANNMRAAAAAKWGEGVDSVALIDVDRTAFRSIANGIGYKCF